MISNTGQANKATIWFVIGFIVVVTAGVIIAGAYSSGTSSNNASSTFVSTTAPTLTSADWTEGNLNAKVSLVEYGDFECPACGEYFPLVQQLVQNYSSTVLFVFRNFPLTTIHPFAQIGAQAAEAAGLEGGASKYWAMHDLLYTDQTQWSGNTALTPAQVVSQYFDGYAQSIGLDINTFNTDLSATAVLDKIQTDVNGGNTAQIDHTPTFFVNLQQIPNPQSLQDFESTLNAAIASSTAQ
ncbi:MAG TPA: thioredoxin domain-containing protein [Candidatus Paceibacterota bacterium]